MSLKGQGWDLLLQHRLKQFYKEYNAKYGPTIQDNAPAIAGKYKDERGVASRGRHHNDCTADSKGRDRKTAQGREA